MLLYHYLSSTSQRTSPLPVSLSLHLPVLLDESISGQMFSGALALLGQDMSPLPILWSRTELKLSWARDHMPEEVFTEPRRAARGYHHPGRMTRTGVVRPGRRKAACLHFLFWCHGFPRSSKKERIGHSHTCSQGLRSDCRERVIQPQGWISQNVKLRAHK